MVTKLVPTCKPGTFVRGHDARRHALTTEERRRGGVHRALQEHFECDLAIELPLWDGNTRRELAQQLAEETCYPRGRSAGFRGTRAGEVRGAPNKRGL